MTAPEREVRLEQAGEGAVLARALVDEHGAVLLAQGAVLSSASLAALRRRQVGYCWIVADVPDDAMARAQADAARQQQLVRLPILFRGTPPGAAGAGLLALLQRYRQGEDA